MRATIVPCVAAPSFFVACFVVRVSRRRLRPSASARSFAVAGFAVSVGFGLSLVELTVADLVAVRASARGGRLRLVRLGGWPRRGLRRRRSRHCRLGAVALDALLQIGRSALPRVGLAQPLGAGIADDLAHLGRRPASARRRTWNGNPDRRSSRCPTCSSPTDLTSPMICSPHSSAFLASFTQATWPHSLPLQSVISTAPRPV